MNIKLSLRKGQSYTGIRAYGLIQYDVTRVVKNLLNGTIEIKEQPLVTHEYISFRLTQEQVNKLGLLAKSKNISIQELLRRGLEQSNLTAQLEN